MDAIDLEILDTLQTDGRLTNVELAERIGLSASPCSRRLRRLEQMGIITGYRAMLDRAKVGLGLTLFVQFKVEGGHLEDTAATLEEAIRGMPEVVSCHIVSGEADFLLEIVVRDLPHYEELLFGSLLKLPKINDIRSNFAIRSVKASAPLPLVHLT